MLTRNDRTIPEARSLVEPAKEAGVSHVGCKDVGLPRGDLALLFADLRAAGLTSYLEVVSERPADNLASAYAALDVRPDHLIGGTERAGTAAILAGSGIRHWPYVGRIVGHPCLLRGSVEEIVADATRAEQAGADGINLLAYRWNGDGAALTAAVARAVRIPVLVAGSIDSAERIAAVEAAGAAAFTIGTAVLDGTFEPRLELVDRLRRVVELAG